MTIVLLAINTAKYSHFPPNIAKESSTVAKSKPFNQELQKKMVVLSIFLNLSKMDFAAKNLAANFTKFPLHPL